MDREILVPLFILLGVLFVGVLAAVILLPSMIKSMGNIGGYSQCPFLPIKKEQEVK